MSDSILINKHPMFLYAQDIADICKPLNSLEISYFSHVRIDNQGTFSGICNNPDFAKHYLTNKYYNADIHLAEDNHFERYILWDALEKDGETEKMDQEACEFGVRHTFTLLKKGENSKDYYHFSTHIKSAIINQVYLNNLDVLEQFVSYFNNAISGSKELSEVYDLKFTHNASSQFILKNINKFENLNEKRQEFFEKIFAKNFKSGRIILPHKETQKPVNLTAQQQNCLTWLLQGLSSKEIARKLNISHRTVEEHLARIKKILGCRTSKELILFYNFPWSSYGPRKDQKL